MSAYFIKDLLLDFIYQPRENKDSSAVVASRIAPAFKPCGRDAAWADGESFVTH